MTVKKEKTVTQNDVAKAAGVTRSMVSYVISGNTERSVAPETRERILKVIEELGYRPNKAAQQLQQGDVGFASKKIGVILSSSDVFYRPYYAEIIAGIHQAAHQNNFNVSFIRFFDELKDPVLFNNLIHPETIGSLILVATEYSLKTDADKKIIERIKERIPKTVCIEWKYDGLTSVTVDRSDAGFKACDYLIKKGYKNIAYIGEKDERIQGVQLALSQNNLNSNTSDFILGYSFAAVGGYDVIKEAYEKNNGKLPGAIVCGSDEVACGVLCFLNEKQISIPDQIGIISIDNIEISAFTCPPLTTINVQKKGMGFRAVEMIVNNTVGQDENAMVINLPTEIVERKSC